MKKKDPTNAERQRRFYKLHKDELNEKRRKIYQERKKSGICPRCGKDPQVGKTLCVECLKAAQQWNENARSRRKVPASKAM